MNYIAIAAAVLFIGLLVLMAVIDLSVVFGGFLSWVGNPVLRKLGLQGDSLGSQYIGRLAKVISCEESQIRVEFEGTTWNALSATPEWSPGVGESVRIDGVDGISLKISKVD